MAKIGYLLAPLLLLMGADVAPPPPMAAYAIAVQEHGEKPSLRAVIIQLDATHAVVGNAHDTEGLTLKDGKQVEGDLKTVPLPDLFDLGKAAPIKRGIVVVCGPDSSA